MSDIADTNGADDHGEPDGRQVDVSLVIEAPPEQLWDMVADVTRMGEWSPECYRCTWIGSTRRPTVGAKFRGYNKRHGLRWFTTNVVEEADRGKAFVFRTRENGNKWGFRFDAEHGGTRVTEFRRLPDRRPVHARALLVFLGGKTRYDASVPEGIRQTLERLKAAAEG